MLVLFTGKSRASCRFLHSTCADPGKCSLGNLRTGIECRTKSCIFSGLEQCTRFLGSGVFGDYVVPKLAWRRLTDGGRRRLGGVFSALT
jgi:hypothetical protein